jgi:hypothetical protein
MLTTKTSQALSDRLGASGAVALAITALAALALSFQVF